jgi:hypothetical protein
MDSLTAAACLKTAFQTNAVTHFFFFSFRTDQPRLVDPYERKTVHITSAGDNMGDGVFAKRDIDAENELLAYYSGFIYNNTDRPVVNMDNMTIEEV